MIVATVEEALAGLDGWFRWNAWAAHFFVSGVQQCNTNHSYAAGGMARGLPPARPKRADLSIHGQPFGRVCQRCLSRNGEEEHAQVTPEEYEDQIVKACSSWLRDCLPARFRINADGDVLRTLLVELEAGGWRTKLPVRMEGEIPLPDVREARLMEHFQEVDAAAGSIAYSDVAYSTVAQRRRLRRALDEYRRLRDDVAMAVEFADAPNEAP